MAREGGETTGQKSWEAAGSPSLVELEEDAAEAPPGWPSIADYWPDAPHRIGPEPDVYHLDESPAPLPASARRPFRAGPPVDAPRRPPIPESAAPARDAAPMSTPVPDKVTPGKVTPEQMVTEEFVPSPAPAGPVAAAPVPAGGAEPFAGDPAGWDAVRADPVRTASPRDHSGPDHGMPDHGMLDRDGPERGGPDRDGPDRDGPDRDGPDRDGPDQTGRDHGGREHGGSAYGAEDEPRDPFEDLVLAEDFQHHPAPPHDDDLHWDGETAARPRRGGRVLATVALALLLLVGLTALIVVQLPGSADDPGTTAAPAVPDTEADADRGAPTAGVPADDPADTPDAAPPADDGRTASAPRDGRSEATFALLTDATVLSVRTTSLDDDLFRISTPEDGGVRPNAVTSAEEVRLFLEPSENEKAPAEVEVLLSDQVRWSVRLLAGVDEGAVDLSAADVAEVTLAGGATTIELSLPSPTGTLPIKLTKGANRLTVRTPDRVPARVAIRQGAGKVQLDGRSANGIAKGEVFQTGDWQGATDRLDLDASAGVGTLTFESA